MSDATADLWPTYVPPARYRDPNPMVRRYGFGPDGETCRGCALLVRVRPGAKMFRKCKLRGITRGPGTDHKVSFTACARFQGRSTVTP